MQEPIPLKWSAVLAQRPKYNTVSYFFLPASAESKSGRKYGPRNKFYENLGLLFSEKNSLLHLMYLQIKRGHVPSRKIINNVVMTPLNCERQREVRLNVLWQNFVLYSTVYYERGHIQAPNCIYAWNCVCASILGNLVYQFSVLRKWKVLGLHTAPHIGLSR